VKPRTKIVVSANEWETRVAIIEDDRLVEFYVETEENKNLVGRIYKGRVENVVKGLRGAFVNVGLRKNGFLPLTEIPEFDALEGEGEEDKPAEPKARTITLNEGEEILVQVIKDPFAEKGARLTSFISIPGRYLVYFPNAERVGVSRRIWDRKERARLRGLVKRFKDSNAGLIIRTVADGARPEELEYEYRKLEQSWNEVRRKAEELKPPAVLYEEPSIGMKLVRDQFTAGVEKVVIDSSGRYREITEYLDHVAPKLRRRVELYQGEVPLLEQAGVEVWTFPAVGSTVDLRTVLRRAAAAGITSVMIEGGAELAARALAARVVDEVQLFVAPLLLGSGVGSIGDLGIRRLDAAVRLTDVSVRRLGADLLYQGKVQYPCSPA